MRIEQAHWRLATTEEASPGSDVFPEEEKAAVEEPVDRKKRKNTGKLMSVKSWPGAHRGYGAITMKWE